MAIQDDKTLLCKGDLKAYHESISPYLGGNLMLDTNVSDYYSTEEKIVGVWIDGKPIYQITKKFTNPSVSWSGINFGFKVDAVWLVNIFAKTSDGWSSGCSWYNTDSNRGSFYVHKDSSGNVNLWIRNTYTVTEAWVTIQYTKTTDAANSAVSTPGCYDINRPDLWPANTEIFFGNGLYGYRAVSTIDRTISANGQYNSDPITTNITYMLNQGGKVKSKTGGWYFVFGATSLADSIASGWWVDPSNSNTLKYYIENAKNSTQVFTDFDVWVTYTK